jgi:hypothetical protein
MSMIKSVVGESMSGVRLEARIIKEDGKPYSIRYYVDGGFKQEELFPEKSIQYLESTAQSWISGIKVLNG